MLQASDLISKAMQAIEGGEYLGFCLSCGESRYECEPDARNYECEECCSIAVTSAGEWQCTSAPVSKKIAATRKQGRRGLIK